jgi:hypothetical protein
MTRGTKTSPRARARRAQADLFSDSCPNAASLIPSWLDLPASARQTVTDLLASLLRAHAVRAGAPTPREAGDDR